MKASNFTPKVSIVLPCRNEQGYIQACLESALKQEPPEGGFEILVADGMSTDGTREYLQQMAKQHPQIRFLDNPGRIVSTGLNAAIRAARGEVIVRMDAHTVYAPDYVINAGGLIYVSLKHRGEELTTITAHLSKIGSRLTEVFGHAQAEKRSPARVADELAERVLYR